VHGGEEPTVVGTGATVGHLCVVHGAQVGAEALIGNGAIVQDGAVIGARALVAAGSTVAPDTEIPAGTVVTGTPAKVRGPLSGSAAWWVENNPRTYRDLARRHAEGARPVQD